LADILWTSQALKDLEKIDKPIVERILRKLDWYARNFDTTLPEPLSGDFKGTYKFRIGDWRVVYVLENETLIIHFVGHRREIYK